MRRPAVTVPQLARALKVGSDQVYRWIRKGFIDTMSLRGYHECNMIIPRDIATRIVSLWRHTCTPTRASKVLGVTDGYVHHLLRKGSLERVKIFGLSRVVSSSVPAMKDKIGRGVEHPEKAGFARLSKVRLTELAIENLPPSERHVLTKEEKQKGGRNALKIVREMGKVRPWTRDQAIEMSKRSKSRWTPEQARIMAQRSVASRRKKAAERRGTN